METTWREYSIYSPNFGDTCVSQDQMWTKVIATLVTIVHMVNLKFLRKEKNKYYQVGNISFF